MGLSGCGGVEEFEGADELDLVGRADVVFLDAVGDVVFDLLYGELAGFEVIVIEEELSESVFVGFDGAPAVSSQEEFLFEGGDCAFVFWILASFGFWRMRSIGRYGEVLRDVLSGLEGPVEGFGGQVALEESEGGVGVRDFPDFVVGVPAAAVDVVDGVQVLADEFLGQVQGDVEGVVFDEGEGDARG